MAETLITLGGLFLLGLLTDLLSCRTPLPRVTLLIAVGFLIRPSVADVLPGEARKWFPLAANALARCLLREMPYFETSPIQEIQEACRKRPPRGSSEAR